MTETNREAEVGKAMTAEWVMAPLREAQKILRAGPEEMR